MKIRIEQGPKGKKSVAYAIDWLGLERGARTDELALERLQQYRERYAPVAKLAGLDDAFLAEPAFDITEVYEGATSTDFWGISFASSSTEKQEPYTLERFDRDMTLLHACWRFFDEMSARVSAELRQGPRGGGMQRDELINHVFGTERVQLAPKVGVKTPQGVMLTPEGLRTHRADFLEGLRAAQEAGRTKAGRTWTLSLLVRRTAYHALDHAWEMEDRDLGAGA